MNQLENTMSLADRLMMGPDGVVYALRAGTLQVSPTDDFGGAEALSFVSYSAEVPRRDGGDIPLCFKYSAEGPGRDGGDPPICFKYSADGPGRDGGDVPVCFAY